MTHDELYALQDQIIDTGEVDTDTVLRIIRRHRVTVSQLAYERAKKEHFKAALEEIATKIYQISDDATTAELLNAAADMVLQMRQIAKGALEDGDAI